MSKTFNIIYFTLNLMLCSDFRSLYCGDYVAASAKKKQADKEDIDAIAKMTACPGDYLLPLPTADSGRSIFLRPRILVKLKSGFNIPRPAVYSFPELPELANKALIAYEEKDYPHAALFAYKSYEANEVKELSIGLLVKIMDDLLLNHKPQILLLNPVDLTTINNLVASHYEMTPQFQEEIRRYTEQFNKINQASTKTNS